VWFGSRWELSRDHGNSHGSTCHCINFIGSTDMKQSESIKELATALCLAQAEMGGAVKDSKNPFFKSSYADLTSVIKAVKEPFANHGLSFIQLPVSNETYVGVTTMLMHKSGEWLQGEYMLPITKRDPQAAGSAITYARRYALSSLCGIPAVDDDAESSMLRTQDAGQSMSLEGVASKPAEEPKKRVDKALIQRSMVAFIEAYERDCGPDIESLWSELEAHEKEALWSQLDGKQKKKIRESTFKEEAA
jgi:hypothetical protein